MTVFDHLGITVDNVARSTEQFDPLMQALAFDRTDGDGSVSWYREGETEFILMPTREPDTGPHTHGHVGWQHLAFAVESPVEVQRLHAIAVQAGWSPVREPKKYPRFTERYYASFLEDDKRHPH